MSYSCFYKWIVVDSYRSGPSSRWLYLPCPALAGGQGPKSCSPRHREDAETINHGSERSSSSRTLSVQDEAFLQPGAWIMSSGTDQRQPGRGQPRFPRSIQWLPSRRLTQCANTTESSGKANDTSRFKTFFTLWFDDLVCPALQQLYTGITGKCANNNVVSEFTNLQYLTLWTNEPWLGTTFNVCSACLMWIHGLSLLIVVHVQGVCNVDDSGDVS